MFVTGVVDHQIHDDLHTPLVCAVEDLFEGFHTAEFFGDVHIVGNIVAAVCAGGRIQGGEPDAVTAQGLDVVQLFQHTPQVTHAVAVAVFEAPGPDLIKYHIFKPAIVLHKNTPLFQEDHLHTGNILSHISTFVIYKLRVQQFFIAKNRGAPMWGAPRQDIYFA